MFLEKSISDSQQENVEMITTNILSERCLYVSDYLPVDAKISIINPVQVCQPMFMYGLIFCFLILVFYTVLL